MLQNVTLRDDNQYQIAHFFIINLTESAMSVSYTHLTLPTILRV